MPVAIFLLLAGSLHRPFANYTQIERRLHLSEAIYKNYDSPTAAKSFWADVHISTRTTACSSVCAIVRYRLIKKDIRELALEFYSFLIDEDGAIVDFAAIPVRMDLKNKQLRERLIRSGVKVWSQLLAIMVLRQFVVCLLIRLLGILTFTNPIEMQNADLTTSYPFFPATNLQWLVWPKPPGWTIKTRCSTPISILMGSDQMFFPDLTPSLKKAETDRSFILRFITNLQERKILRSRCSSRIKAVNLLRLNNLH